MAASSGAIELDVSMDGGFEEQLDDAMLFDDENFNPNNNPKSKKMTSSSGKMTTGSGKEAVTVAAAKTKVTTHSKQQHASQKTIEQTYQKKTQLEVSRYCRLACIAALQPASTDGPALPDT